MALCPVVGYVIHQWAWGTWWGALWMVLVLFEGWRVVVARLVGFFTLTGEGFAHTGHVWVTVGCIGFIYIG